MESVGPAILQLTQWEFMKNFSREIVSTLTFRTTSLAVERKLLGRSHTVTVDKISVEISLPTVSDIPTGREEDGGKLAVVAARRRNNREFPTQFAVYRVEVKVVLPKTVRLPRGFVYNRQPIYRLFSKSHRKVFDSYGAKALLIAESAFDIWIGMLRYKCRNARIGRPPLGGVVEAAGELRDRKSNKYITNYNPPVLLTLPSAITGPKWKEIDRALKAGEKSPVHFELYFDGIFHQQLGDYQRAVIDYAVASELFIRTHLGVTLPQTLPKPIRNFIDKTSIFTVRDDFFPSILTSAQAKKFRTIKGDLKKLFETRNKIMHSGVVIGLTKTECERFRVATYELLTLR